MPVSGIIKKIFKAVYKNRSVKNWKDFEYFDIKWKKRIQLMAALIDKETTILDLGCGKMWLREFLPQDCIYYGCDYTPRDEKTIVCDFNKKEFPSVIVDCCFASGVVEYLDDPDFLFKQVYLTAKSLILSYCPIEIQPDIGFRKSLGWRNQMSRFEINERLRDVKFVKKIEIVNKNGHDIYKFVK
jgi:hypothetical protein